MDSFAEGWGDCSRTRFMTDNASPSKEGGLHGAGGLVGSGNIRAACRVNAALVEA